MNPVAQAEALLTDMLKAGPLAASEAFKAAAAAGLGERTVQRASQALGVAKAKNGHGGWTWRLPTPEESRPKDEPGRAAVIAQRLRGLEKRRGKTAPIYAGDPRLCRWVAAGISDPDLREAYDRAVFALRGGGPVTVGFLEGFVAEIIGETT